jgi:hypothetical protein
MRLLFFMKKPVTNGSTRSESMKRAREEAMEQMRLRLEEAAQPPPVVLPQATAPADEEPVPPAADPLAGLADISAASAEAADGERPGATPSGETPAVDDAFDSSLLDIFRDAKKETEEGTLAAEVEDVAIADLLGDIRGIGSRLGVKPRPVVEPEPDQQPKFEAEATLEQPDSERDASLAPEPEAPPEEDPDEPLDAAGEDAAVAVSLSLPHGDDPAATLSTPLPGVEEALGVQAPTPSDEDPSAQVVPPARAEATLEALPLEEEVVPPAPSSSDGEEPRVALPGLNAGHGGRYLLHVLFLGLAFAAAAGAGLRTAYDRDAFASAAPPAPPPAILAYLRPPLIVPEPEPIDSWLLEHPDRRDKPPAVATPTPQPAPTASPTPAPARDPHQYSFRPGQPAYVVYRVRTGDDLAAIGKAYGVCPDHILWSNPGREIGDALRTGDDLILPGYPGIVYKVKDGDTVSLLASRYSTEPGMIVAYPGNKLSEGEALEPGKSILLPEAIPPEAFMQSAEARWAYTHPSAEGYIWPFYGPITSRFGEQRPGYTHYAIDIGGLYQFGTPVLAAASGVVEKAEHGDEGYGSEGYGNHVIIRHQDGSRSLYGHMTKVYVEEGDDVGRAQPVGSLGCTGHSTGTHLHFELYRNGAAVDPLAYLPQP